MITQHYERQLRASGLRGTQFTTLTLLSLAGPLPLTVLAEKLGTERTTLTRNLQVLLSRGLVTERESNDKRIRTLAITPKGTAAARAALPHWRRAQSLLSDQLGASVVQGLKLAATGATRLTSRHPAVSRGRKKR